MEKPPNAEASSRAEIVDYYVQTLTRVLSGEKEAQMCIYRASCEKEFFFCCDIDENSSRLLARVPGVISVSPDASMKTSIVNTSTAKQSNLDTSASRFFPPVDGNCDCWLVKMKKPGVEVVTKAQMVDYFALSLTKVLGNEQDAQVSIYNVSWERDFGFCCRIDEECARELSDVPEVLSVQPDVNFESEYKNYGADDMPLRTEETHDSTNTSSLPTVKTKRLFVTGLSFYTSVKTLRAAFEPFGELVEVKIIMDKISKRSKGYAFIEYTTEEAAGAALKEMNGKIINGWMIVVDVAKINPPKYSRGRPSPPSY